VLILLPPSQGKLAPERGGPLELEALSFAPLNPTRQTILASLERLSAGNPARARRVLALSPRQDAEIQRNRLLSSAPTAPAHQVYAGVLYDALDYEQLPSAARRRANRWVVVSSALWGALRLTDRIPTYRLSAGTVLPRVGNVDTRWREALAGVLSDAAGRGVVLDLRSGAYAALWTPTGSVADRTVVARVLQRRRDGSTAVVSHHNKATKGRLVAALARQVEPLSLEALAEAVAATGAVIELIQPTRGRAGRLDITVDEL
jgi:hypothetical protein